MNRTLLVIILVVLSFGLYAQWSTNAANPTQICNLTNAQVMPKTAVSCGGVTWIAWMDNTTGNYNTYLQRLDINGVAQWTNPVLVSSHTTMTWLTEWDMSCDAACNAVLVFQDFRLGTNNVVAYKVSPQGDFLWGQNGILLSNDTSDVYANMSPTVLCLSSGRTVAAWQRMGTATTIVMQSISATGTLEWGTEGITLFPDTGSYTWPQLLESADDNILLKFYEDTGPFWAPIRKILVQKFSPAGSPLWANPVYVQNLGGISAWNQWLSLSSDGMGGMILVWHDDRNQENISYSYIQRVLVNGTVTMPDNGVLVSTETGFHQFYPKLAFEPVLNEAYVFWNRVNGGQSMWGLQMQKFTLDGTRQWAEQGLPIVTLDNFPTYPICAFNMDTGVAMVYSIGPISGNDQITNLKAFCANPEGLSVWNGGLGWIATTNTNKLHYDNALYLNQWGVVVWEEGNGPSNICAMRLNYDGSLGMLEPSPYGLMAEVVEYNNVLLTWNFPEVAVNPIGFKVYRNDVFYHLVAGSDTYQDYITNLGPGEWSFYVTALYEDNEESPPSNTVLVNITGTQEEQIALLPLSVLVHPNPFQNGVNLLIKGNKDSGRTDVAIYNLKGQLVRQISLEGKTELNWLWDGTDSSRAPVSSGLYLLQVTSGQQQLTTKLLKL